MSKDLGRPGAGRVLLFGTDAASGLGVLTHELALPGHLARSISERSGRVTRVDLVQTPGSRIGELSGLARTVVAADYDGIAVVCGVSDAARLCDLEKWRASVLRLLHSIRASGKTVPIVFVGVPELSSLPGVTLRAGGLVDRWAQSMNRVSEEVCAAMHFVTFQPAVSPAGEGPDTRFRSAASYRAMGEKLAAVLTPVLCAHAGHVR